MPTLNWIGKEAVVNHHLQVPFQLLKDVPELACGELKELTQGGKLKEEFQCAQFLDGLPEVKFWTRNLSGKSTSFRLQISTDWFYPDFVCQLVDGRTLVVEYKGKDRYDNADSEEKRAVGAVWGSRSDGRCLFAMPTDRDFTAISSLVRS
jgi:type III restriction enzyme